MEADQEEIEVDLTETEDSSAHDENETHAKTESTEVGKSQPAEAVEEIEEVENIEPVEETAKPAIEKVESWNGTKQVPADAPEEVEEESVEEFESKEDVKVNPEVAEISRPHHVTGGFHDTFVGDSNVTTPTQQKAIVALERDEKQEIDDKAKADAEKRDRRRKSEDSENCFVSFMAWLYGIIACCNPLLPPPRKRNRGSSDRDIDLPTLSETYHVDAHIRDIFADAECMIKETYVREAGGGNLDSLKLTVVSYKTLKSGGINYFTKIKVNDGNEFIHARIFKAGRAKALLMGDLQLNRSEDDEINQF